MVCSVDQRRSHTHSDQRGIRDRDGFAPASPLDASFPDPILLHRAYVAFRRGLPRAFPDRSTMEIGVRF